MTDASAKDLAERLRERLAPHFKGGCSCCQLVKRDDLDAAIALLSTQGPGGDEETAPDYAAGWTACREASKSVIEAKMQALHDAAIRRALLSSGCRSTTDNAALENPSCLALVDGIQARMRWLEENDPSKSAICVVGARRAEAADPNSTRARFPEYLVRSANHGDRMMLAPMVDYDANARNALLLRAGVTPLPHRSGECKCINSNKADMRRFSTGDIAEIEAIEAEIGRPMYRPHRHLGATGIHEVVRWANSERGKYTPEPEAETCNSGWCEQ